MSINLQLAIDRPLAALLHMGDPGMEGERGGGMAEGAELHQPMEGDPLWQLLGGLILKLDPSPPVQHSSSRPWELYLTAVQICGTDLLQLLGVEYEP